MFAGTILNVLQFFQFSMVVTIIFFYFSVDFIEIYIVHVIKCNISGVQFHF